MLQYTVNIAVQRYARMYRHWRQLRRNNRRRQIERAVARLMLEYVALMDTDSDSDSDH